MCEPISGSALTIAGIAASAVGTGVSMYGQYQAGQAQQGQANYQAAIARNNVLAASQAAATSRQQGQQQAAQDSIKGRQLISAQRATFGANGVDANTGSADDIQADTAEFNKLDQLTVVNNAERQAIGFENQGANFNAQAGADTIAGENAASAGVTGAAGTLFSGAGQVASKWYQYTKDFPGSDPSTIPGFVDAPGSGVGFGGGF